MKLIALTAVSALALASAACTPSQRASAALTGRLDCPEKSGELKRVSVAADGKSCLYRISDTTEITLRLVSLDGVSPDIALARIETELHNGAAQGGAADPPPALAGKESAALAAKAVAQANADTAKTEAVARAESRPAEEGGVLDDAISSAVNAKLREKGIDTADDDSDDQVDAHIHLPGVHVDTSSDQATVRVGPINIDTNGEHVNIKSMQDVRLRGEGFSAHKRGIQAMFLFAADQLNDGYKFVGYEAAGPRTGPLTVAIVKSKAEDGFHGDILGDIKRLVRRNAGT